MSEKIINYDNFPKEELEDICEAENNAEVLIGFIEETLEFKDNPAKRREEILQRWATYMNSFWDDGNDLDEEAHYGSNWNWGSDLLDAMDEYINKQNSNT